MWQFLTAAVSRATEVDWLLLLFGALLVLYIVGTWNYDYFQKRGIASTKPKIPFLGDMTSMFLGRKSFAETIRDQYDMCKKSGIFGFFVFTEPIFVVSDTELLKVITVKEFDSFMNHRAVGSDKADPLFSKNLFNLQDQQWRDMRTTLSPAFTTSKIKGMFPLVSQCCGQLALHLRQKYANSPEGAKKTPLESDMKDLFTRMANDVIATAAFGVNCDSLKNPENEFYKMGKLMTTFTKIRNLGVLGYLIFPKLMAALGIRVLDGTSTNFFDTLVHDTIRERRKRSIFRPDMLQLLMQAQKGELKEEKEDAAESEEVGTRKQLTDEDVTAQAVIFFFAGFETVSVALCVATYLLSHHREEQKRLQEEITEAMEKTNGKPTYETVQSMKYLDAVISEVLRMYPPNPGSDRMCKKDIILPATAKIVPVTIRKDQGISIPIIGLHYDAEHWDEPERFNPDRFSDKNKHKIKPFSYIPFGVGPRLCIGQRFALIEVKLALMHLLMNFDLHPCAKTKHPLQYEPGFNFMVKGGFWCGITPRDVDQKE